MATDTDMHIPDYSQWRNRHTPDAEHWHDLKRMGNVLVPIFLLLFIATMAAVLYAFLHINDWGESINSKWEFFWLQLCLFFTYLSPLLIAILSITLLYRSVIKYARAFYNKPDQTGMFSLIQRRLLGIPPVPPPMNTSVKYPFVSIKSPEDFKKDHPICWLGGPVTLVVYDGFALYLERGGRFSRVVGPGKPPMPFLDRHETVKALVDLRPQVKTGMMHPWTKDGIQVDMEIRMECQIDASEQAFLESQNLVNPFDPIAVKNAVEYTAVKRDPATGQLYESDWLDGIWGQVTGYLARHISCHSIDEIALVELKDIGPSNGHLQSSQLAKKQLDKINQNLAERRCGAHITNIHLVIKAPEEVEKKRIAYWQSERNRIAIIRDSRAEANGIRVTQEARAKAERDLLNTIIEKLGHLDPDSLTEPLLVSLTGILDNSLDDPFIRSIIAKNSLSLLEQLRKNLKDRF